jgi:HlyD family secretion protein
MNATSEPDPKLKEQDGPHDAAGGAVLIPHDVVPAISPKLPVPLPPELPRHRRLLRRAVILLLLLAVGAVGGAIYWLKYSEPSLPPGFASGNGRLEADEIDIDTKFAGRIAKLFADEGDMVKADQVVALMDTRDLEASLKKSEALVLQAQRTLDEAKANLVQQQTQVTLAKQELDRTSALVLKGYATLELLDQRRQQMAGAVAAENAATDKIGEAQRALEAAMHDVELYKVNIADNALFAPREGRIQYRVANVGEVLPAGGKVFTMLDTSYVYMDIYLPTAEAGRIRLGSDARIILDAYPTHVIPAKVVFIASQAQFTPKEVETQQERDKLMFRIRVKIDPDRLLGHAEIVRSGLPGVAYVHTNPDAAWPPQLQASAPP